MVAAVGLQLSAWRNHQSQGSGNQVRGTKVQVRGTKVQVRSDEGAGPGFLRLLALGLGALHAHDRLEPRLTVLRGRRVRRVRGAARGQCTRNAGFHEPGPAFQGGSIFASLRFRVFECMSKPRV